VREIGSTYDDIYTRRTQVWEDQGRTPEFISYFSGLVGATDSLLEIGCGEGILLTSLPGKVKSAVDISGAALRKARAASGASCAVALAERLPFADASFDTVVSVGVMEHFLDDKVASAEIRRVLKPSGRYLALIHLRRTTSEKALQKVREFFFPRPRPIALLRWLFGKVYKPIHQPIQRGYTTESGRQCVESSGLKVDRVISNATDPSAPLVGPHVVIYVARK
jgi:SAM-dependent methyltransferase